MSFFISRRYLAILFIIIIASIVVASQTSINPGYHIFTILVFGLGAFYLILTRTNLIGRKARKNDDGSITESQGSKEE